MIGPSVARIAGNSSHTIVIHFCTIRRMRYAYLVLLVPALGIGLANVPQLAGQRHPPSKPTTRQVAATRTCGPIADDLLKCSRFGFTYKIPFGWVDRTGDMQPDADAGKQESGKVGEAQGGGAKDPATLLAIFERPPAAPGDSINSAVVMVAESLSDYHGIKTAADYFGPITELAEQREFKVQNEPYAFSIGPRQLVRGDFRKQRGQLTMWQSSLVMIEKGYIVSFTFVGGSEDEVEDLIGNLSFGMRTKTQPGLGK